MTSNVDFPAQRRNPARELYNFWYSLVQHSAPHLLDLEFNSSYSAAAYLFSDHTSLHVDRDSLVNGKPSLNVPEVMRIWPNGYFQVHQYAWSERGYTSTLNMLERNTFLRWGYVGRGKALWVQDTPRRGTGVYTNKGAVNREHPQTDGYLRRVPYLPLFHQDLFKPYVQYRLSRRGDHWIIVAHDRLGAGVARAKDRRISVRAAQRILDERYDIAERRYSWWETRHRRAEERAKNRPRPVKTTEVTERFVASFVKATKVWEPKLGPGGVPYVRPDLLPMGHEEEVLHGGTENDLAASSLAQ